MAKDGKKTLLFGNAREKFSDWMLKMSKTFLYLSGKSIGYSYVRDMGLIVKHNEKVVLLEDVVEASEDIQTAIEKGELEVIKTVPSDEISTDDLEKLYAGDPIEVDGVVYISKNSSRFIAPAKPKLSVGRDPNKPQPVRKKSKVKKAPQAETVRKAAEPQVIEKVTERVIEKSTGLSDEDRQKLDSVTKLAEQFPELIQQLTKSVAESVKDSIQVSVNTVAPTGVPTGVPSGDVVDLSSNVEVPVVLKEMGDVKTSLGESADTKEEDSSSLAEKLKALKDLENS
jgi:hypothetical protein